MSPVGRVMLRLCRVKDLSINLDLVKVFFPNHSHKQLKAYAKVLGLKARAGV